MPPSIDRASRLKRANPPAQIRVQRSKIWRRESLEYDSDNEDGKANLAATVRDNRRKQRRDPQSRVVAPAEDDDTTSESEISEPDTPASPLSPSSSPIALLPLPPPPAQQQPALPPPPPPAPPAGPRPPAPSLPPVDRAPVQAPAPRVTFTPIAPPRPSPGPPPALPPPSFASRPPRPPNLAIGEQEPDWSLPTTTGADEETTDTSTTTTSSSSSSSSSSTTFSTTTTAAPDMDQPWVAPGLIPPTTSSSPEPFLTGTASFTGTPTAIPVQWDGPPGGMDPDTHHAVIAVSSICACVLVALLGWLGWRTFLRHRDRGQKTEGAGTSRRPTRAMLADRFATVGSRVAPKIPFLRKTPWATRAWVNLESGRDNDYLPDEKPSRASLRKEADFNFPDEKKMASQISPTVSRDAPPPDGLRANPFSMEPTNDNSTGSPAAEEGTFDSMAGNYANTNDHNLTLRTMGSGGPLFEESDRLKKPSKAHTVAKSHGSRASEISSLSSGFGDLDIVIPMTALLYPPPVPALGPAQSGSQPARPTTATTTNPNGPEQERLSWVSRSNSSNRETIYTETSEDLPARFRSVSSWVNQQTGRIKRAQAREERDGDIPPVPGLPAGPGLNGIPPEQKFTMMMPDGEEPRRPDAK